MTKLINNQNNNLMSKEKIELLKKTIAKGCTNDELELFGLVCNKTGLDPFMKQIFPVKRKTKNGDVMTIQTSIDGLRLIADRSGRYSPGKEPIFTYNEKKELVSATSYVKKMTADGTWHEVSVTAFYDEYKPNYSNDFWNTKPHIMLAKCAESLALRKAFPAEMSGIYSKEEMENSPIEVIADDQFAIDKLKTELKKDEISTDHLESFLNNLSEKNGTSVEKIIKQALDPVYIERFKSAYSKELESHLNIEVTA